MTTVAEVNELTGRLSELVKQVQAGHAGILTQDHKPVPKLGPAAEAEAPPGAPLQIRPLKGHRVLIPAISQAELAKELFGRQ